MRFLLSNRKFLRGSSNFPPFAVILQGHVVDVLAETMAPESVDGHNVAGIERLRESLQILNGRVA
jgi:hypothetical protein